MFKKQRSAEFKKKVAIEALKEKKTLNEIASEYEVRSRLVSRWKKELIDNARSIFETYKDKNLRKEKEEKRKLLEKIGELTFELDWLKKKIGFK